MFLSPLSKVFSSSFRTLKGKTAWRNWWMVRLLLLGCWCWRHQTGKCSRFCYYIYIFLAGKERYQSKFWPSWRLGCMHILFISSLILNARSWATLFELKILKQLITTRTNIVWRTNGCCSMVAAFTFTFHCRHCKSFLFP